MSKVALSVGNTSILVLAVEITGILWGDKIAWGIPAIFAGKEFAV